MQPSQVSVTHVPTPPLLYVACIYKCLHTNYFGAKFPLPSHAIPTTVPAIPTTIPDAQNLIKCRHCTEMHSCWLLFMVIELSKHKYNKSKMAVMFFSLRALK